jgi:hypothetical protein
MEPDPEKLQLMFIFYLTSAVTILCIEGFGHAIETDVTYALAALEGRCRLPSWKMSKMSSARNMQRRLSQHRQAALNGLSGEHHCRYDAKILNY